MLTIEEIKRQAVEIAGGEITLENHYSVAQRIHSPIVYSFREDINARQQQDLYNLPEVRISREAWRSVKDECSLLERLVCTVATWQRNAAIIKYMTGKGKRWYQK